MNYFMGLLIFKAFKCPDNFLVLLIEILLKIWFIFFKSSRKFNDVDKTSWKWSLFKSLFYYILDIIFRRDCHSHDGDFFSFGFVSLLWYLALNRHSVYIYWVNALMNLSLPTAIQIWLTFASSKSIIAFVCSKHYGQK